MTNSTDDGRDLALAALRGETTERVPYGVLTWGYDYLWRVAGLAPWELACGGTETYHRALIALLDRHQPDILWFLRTGAGPEEPTLLDEDARCWVARDNNTGLSHALLKDSYTMVDPDSGAPRRAKALADIHSEADADDQVPRDGSSPDQQAQLARLVQNVGERALVVPCASPGYIRACYAFGFERAMEMMMFEQDLFVYVCDRYLAQEDKRMADYVAAGVQAVYIADGWASCDVISPAMFERFALPYQVATTEAAHRAGLRIILWNEGDVLPILEQEASVPVDAFHFEQPRKGVDLTVARVREVFGDDRCLFGNVDSEELFARNDADEIKAAVESQIRQSGRGAPFVLSTGSPVPSNVDPAAVDAMVEAARAFRW